nr:MFS transporter [Chloroflexota bacterium]
MSTTNSKNRPGRHMHGARTRLSRSIHRRASTGLWPNRAFVTFWAADSISQFGSQASMVALPLLAALTLDASPFEMGALSAAGSAPFLLVSLHVGAWVDRLPRRPILIAADLGSFAFLLTIPLAAWRGWMSMELLYVVSFLVGVLTICFGVAWVAYLPALVQREELTDANGKLAATASVAQVSGPSVAGGLVALAGAPLAILLDAISFLISAWLIGRIRVEEPPIDSRNGEHRIWREIGEGIGVVTRHPLLRALAASTATTTLGGYMFLAVYVLYMTNDLGLGAGTIGLVFGLGGVGALLGAMIAPAFARWLGVGPAIVWAQLLTGLSGLAIPLAIFAPGIALPLVLFAEFFQ